MNMKAEIELIFLPMPEIGHLLSMVGLAKQVTTTDDRFKVTVLIPTVAFGNTAPPGLETSVSSTKIRFVKLPEVHSSELDSLSGEACYSLWSKLLKPYVKDMIANIMAARFNTTSKLAGFVFDMFFTPMVDVANELGVDCYVYFPSSAAMLALLLHLPTLHAKELATESRDDSDELLIPGFANSVPVHLLPSFMMQREEDDASYKLMLEHAERCKETKGIIVNTLPELEPGILDLNSDEYPSVYPVGPVVALEDGSSCDDIIIKWLDDQPSRSVIFLCFGSRGAFGVAQVHEIAHGLELSGYRFLWSLRQPPKANHDPPSDYPNPEDALPVGFLDRTADRGLICGWAPQRLILAHPAIGGYVSHCGWNSILESLWCGVPILSWPLFAEQKLNAHRLVNELGLATAVRADLMKGRDLFLAYTNGGDLVMRDEVMRGIHRVMNINNGAREKVNYIREKCRHAVMDGGSSFICLKRLIENKFLKN